LGSIAALIYASVGAPDVALTEVLVGTLLSAILYIITIRACYTVLIVVPKDYKINTQLCNQVSDLFNELHLQVKYLKQDFDIHAGNYSELLSATTLSGSPHAVLDNRGICIESPLLLRDLKSTKYYKNNSIGVDLFIEHETANELEAE
jgi:putative multicomponent Na+:H+ antiporter subunit B